MEASEHMERDVVWRNIERERIGLADLLETLSPDQWEAPSWCAGWRVRDVAAHVTLTTRARPLDALVGLMRARGDFNRFVADDARNRSDRPTDQLVSELRAAAPSRHHPPGTRAEDPLVDVLVHTQDIARPLGIQRSMPAEAAVAAADRVWSMSFPFHARRLAAGVELSATDAGWRRGGKGDPAFAGTIADLLLLLTGRPVPAERFSGAGVVAVMARATQTGRRRRATAAG